MCSPLTTRARAGAGGGAIEQGGQVAIVEVADSLNGDIGGRKSRHREIVRAMLLAREDGGHARPRNWLEERPVARGAIGPDLSPQAVLQVGRDAIVVEQGVAEMPEHAVSPRASIALGTMIRPHGRARPTGHAIPAGC